MSDDARKPFDAEAVIEAMMPLLGLPLDPAYRPGIVLNLEFTARFAAIVLAGPSDDDDEPAPVFIP